MPVENMDLMEMIDAGFLVKTDKPEPDSGKVYVMLVDDFLNDQLYVYSPDREQPQ